VTASNEVKLKAHSPTEFTKRGFKFTFILDKKGKPRGIQYLYPSGSGSGSGGEFWPFNDNLDEEAGPNKKEWQDFVGEYTYKIFDDTLNVSVGIKNGYLYFKDQGGLKLNEYKPGIFFTPDGEAVIFQSDRMLLGNVPYLKKSTKTSNQQ
jgi:hypothetical protein